MGQNIHPRAAFVAVALAAVLSACQTTEPSAGRRIATNPVSKERLQSHFSTMDQDQDGFISRPEFQSGRGAVFLAADRDNSVSLTSDELRLTPEAFSKIAGADGVVDAGELFQSGTASFEMIDANNDKQLSYDEFSEFILHFGS